MGSEMCIRDRYSKDMNKDEIGVLCSFGAGYSAGSVILRKT